MAVTPADLTAWITRFDALIDEHQAELTALDSEIGDADHGSNMARGMHAVIAKLDGDSAPTPPDPATTAGTNLLSTLRGARVPPDGPVFLRPGAAPAAAQTPHAPNQTRPRSR